MKQFTFTLYVLVLTGLPLCDASANNATGHSIMPHPTFLAAPAPVTPGSDEESTDYPVNFALTETTGNTGRYLTSLTLAGSADGTQTIAVPHEAPMYLYRPLLNEVFTARAGEKLAPTFGFHGNWMNGYVYIDRGNDGQFSYTLNADYTIPAESDLMTYSYVMATDGNGGYASDGSPLTGNATNVLNPPAFTVPADLAPGYYRMRFKVDWGCVDPGGNTAPTQLIKNNGGEIVDVRLNIHGDYAAITAESAEGGRVTTAEGETLAAYNAPFGKALALHITPAEGYALDGLIVRHGYNLDGDSLVHGTPQYVDVTIPGYLIQDGQYTLPASMVDGDVLIKPRFVELTGGTTTDEDYPLNFAADTKGGEESFTIRVTGGTASAKTIPVTATDSTLYINKAPLQVAAQPGDMITVGISSVSDTVLNAYFYIDFNQDGQFNPMLGEDGRPTLSGELVTYSYYKGKNSQGEAQASADEARTALPTFTVPEGIPCGMYRARLKIDYDDIAPGGSPDIVARGGRIIDMLFNIHNESHPLEVVTTHGSINGTDNTGLPLEVTCFSSLTVVPTPVASGYEATLMTIKHGHNLDGPQFVHGNRQWSTFDRRVMRYNIPADSIDGDLRITVLYEPTEKAEYNPVLIEEFDGETGTQPNEDYWSRCRRQTSTWNRWLSDSESVIYLEDGQLVARAIPNPDRTGDDVPMITGGVQSSGKFDFRYGKIEARILTNPYSGNFPAFWMMPTDQTGGWPTCGEIDIFEQINTEERAYHTVHSHWTYDLGHTGNPRSSFYETVAMDRYHTYGFEWDETMLRWYVDGRQVASYAKSSVQSNLDNGQWPFDKAFYIILNQSVGDGSWAAYPDVNHTFETRFDWVRVYQKADQMTGIATTTAEEAIALRTERGALVLQSEAPTQVSIFDLSGRCLRRLTLKGTERIEMATGLYIVNGKKIWIP